jgi:hypothetical protein
MNETLTDANFIIYAAKHYDNPQCFDTEEFYDDLKRFKYIKRLFNRYEITGELKERLVLNHIVVLYNVFGQHATRMLLLKLRGYYGYLKPFLVLIQRMPEAVGGVGENTVYSSDIVMDENIIEILRKI